MKKYMVQSIKAVRVLALVLFVFTACNSQGQKAGGGSLSADDFEKKLSNTEDYQLVDVRTPGEYAEGHLKNSLNMDYNNTAFDEQIAALDKDKPTFVYCLSGGRSHSAAEKMRSMGFKTVYEMQGGILQWSKLNKPLEKNVAALAPVAQGMTQMDFDKNVRENKVLLVDFNATWCGPCRMLAPILEDVSKEQGDKMKLLSIDTDQNQQLAIQMGIESLPTLMLYKDGKLVWKKIGLTDKQTILNALAM